MVSKKSMYGGKDINPQLFKMYVIQSVVNTYTEQKYQTPVVQNVGNEKALVMEILKVIISFDDPELINITGTSVTVHIADRTRTAIGNLEDSGIMHSDIKGMQCIDTAATDATLAQLSPAGTKVIDLTDGAGNGILYGKSEIYIAIVSAGNAAVKRVRAQLLYRLKEVSASELLGIIQS